MRIKTYYLNILVGGMENTTKILETFDSETLNALLRGKETKIIIEVKIAEGKGNDG